MALPTNRTELLEFIAQCIGFQSSKEIDPSNLKLINKHVMQYVLTDGMTYSEIGYVIHYYVNTLHKKIELLYGLSFVGRVRADAFQAFKHEQQSLDVKSQAALVAAEAILNTEKPVFNITYIDKKPAQRKATQLSYDNIELKEDNDGDNQD